MRENNNNNNNNIVYTDRCSLLSQGPNRYCVRYNHEESVV